MLTKALPLTMKKTRLKKTSKNKISILKKKLWVAFAQFIKLRDGYTCFTCGQSYGSKDNLPYKSAIQAGHFVPKSVGGLVLYFNEDNVHAQCYHCNINLGGNQYLYGKKLGKKADELYQLKHKVEKWSEQDFLDKIKYYEERVKLLQQQVES